jgi:hypothetical protein
MMQKSSWLGEVEANAISHTNAGIRMVSYFGLIFTSN